MTVNEIDAEPTNQSRHPREECDVERSPFAHYDRLNSECRQLIVHPLAIRKNSNMTPTFLVQPSNEIEVDGLRTASTSSLYHVKNRFHGAARIAPRIRVRMGVRRCGIPDVASEGKAFTAALYNATVIARLIQKNG